MVYMRKVPLHLDRNFKSRTSDVYTRQEQVGLGTYGEVFLAEEQNTKAKVALKRIKIDMVKEKRQGFPITAVREIRVLKALRHPNIVALIEVTRSKGAVISLLYGTDHLGSSLTQNIPHSGRSATHETAPRFRVCRHVDRSHLEPDYRMQCA